MDNFIVSARKYRPVTFESVVGQSHITSTLRNAIARAQLAHAYLFCGPRGVGKTTCARIFAKAINCLNPQGSEACGECESCRAFNESRSFNIHELDAASNNSVDDIRSLTEQVRIPPQIGRYSVYIIDEVHMLSSAAFNAFLKTLEEPPAHAIFILATTEKHKIIPTILSRCQIYDFNRIRVEDGVSYLKYIASQENISYDDESLNLIAAKADGGMRDALSMFDKAVAFCGTSLNFREVARTLNVLDYDTYFNITRLAAVGDYKSVLLIFDDVLRKGFSAQTFIGGLAVHLRDLLMCKDAATVPLLEATGTLLERYKTQSAELDTGFLFDAVAMINAADATLRSATNSRLHVELGLMKLCGLGQKKNRLEPTEPTLPPLEVETAAGINVSAGAQAQQSSGAVFVEIVDSAPASTTTAQNGSGAKLSAILTGVGNVSEKTAATPQQERAAGINNTTERTISAQPEHTTYANSPHTEASKLSSATETVEQGTAINTSQPEQERLLKKEEARSTQEEQSVRLLLEEQARLSQKELSAASQTQQTILAVKQSAKSSVSGGRTISGVSINSILRGGAAKNAGSGQEKPEVVATQSASPDCEQNLLAAHDSFIAELSRNRPRFATAFSNMTVKGNKIFISVSTDLLRDDIVQNQREIISLLRGLAGIECNILFDISVTEDKGAVRPIKPEDKLAHLRARNNALDDLRRELELELE